MCGCSTHLISNTIYEEFIRPQDERVLALYPNGGMLHLCGHHTQHLPSWRNMSCIRAMQVNDAATDQLEDYYQGTRPDQILYVCPTPTVGEADAIRITEGGRRLVLV